MFYIESVSEAIKIGCFINDFMKMKENISLNI